MNVSKDDAMSDTTYDQATAQRALVQRLESLQRAGVRQIGKVPAAIAPPVANAPLAPSTPVVEARRSDPPIARQAENPVRERIQEEDMARARSGTPRQTIGTVAAGSSLRDKPYSAGGGASVAKREQALEAINAEVRVCTFCKELACTRNKTVFGIGNLKPRVAFLGEAPGADEDRTGEPFVGKAGQLLTKILEACTFTREEVYILNVLKCRPPDNRTPLPDEVHNCRGYFTRQFDVLQPEYIVCAGSVAAQALLETSETIGKLRGRFHTYRGSKVVATYHPSYLLRNPAAKKFVWEDMQMLLADMGIELPKK
jgi:DNA polymerase